MLITASQARSIRRADALCFDGDMSGEGQIRAITRGTAGISETTHTVPVESNRVNNYSPVEGPWTCFTMLMSAQYDDLAQTLVRRIKAGSRIGFVWTRDNRSPVTEEAGIVVDMLDVKVQNGNVCDTFRVATYIGLDNSARMVRKATVPKCDGLPLDQTTCPDRAAHM